MGKMNNLKIKRAILSVFNKEGIISLAKALEKQNVEIYSTGGTLKKLKEDGIEVKSISSLIDFPEIMGGRVKTLHPKIFAGILADKKNEEHLNDLSSVSISPFDLVVVNLYDFSKVYKSANSTENEIVEMIDIGGPSMLRAAAKNFNSVTVLTDPTQYLEFIQKLENNEIDLSYRKNLAGQVFQHTTKYDAEIAGFFAGNKDADLPELYFQGYEKSKTLPYGENPDQKAAIYKPLSKDNWEPFQQLHGKKISYNNYVDCLAAYKIIQDLEFDEPVVANIKHTNPCGVGVGKTAKEAYLRAVKADSTSYFGGIVCTNKPVNLEFAEELKKSFLECIIAPSYKDESLKVLQKKKNIRLLIANENTLNSDYVVKNYGSGLLIQEMQKFNNEYLQWKLVTETQPSKELKKAMNLGWNIVKNVKSNAIVLADSTGVVGIGAGQMSRVDALKIAIRKAQEAGLTIANCVLASDAFFPFRDSIDLASEYNISGVIQPGGSIKDNEVINACNEHKIFMMFTGRRVFNH